MTEAQNAEERNPKHISIIMDGNRRWAKGRGLPSFEGHRKGADNVEALLDKAKSLNIECVSFWAFSTENWKRSREEVNFLFQILKNFIGKFRNKLLTEEIRFVHLGRKDRLPKDMIKEITKLEEITKGFSKYTLAMAIDYGGHDELIRAVDKLKTMNLEVTEENISKHLDTAGLPPTDLIIRTGGELRLSGFMSWQCAYSELYFTDKFFPDFGPKDLEMAVADYLDRERRFGK